MTHEENLLFATFAVQLRILSSVQALEVTADWAAGPDRSIPERLFDVGAITAEQRAMITRVVEAAVADLGHGEPALRAAMEDEYFCGRYLDRLVIHEPRGDDQSTIAGPGAGLVDAVPLAVAHETPGRYKGESEYARGGMGRVLLVHDVHLGRDIAMKELLPHASESCDTLPADAPSPVRMSVPLIARFLQEARITGQLEHPSIVPVYELGHREDGRLYYTMKLVRGRTLSRAIQQAEGLTDRLALLTHFTNLCQAVAYAHSRGVLHRDLKPSNVMVGEFGETVVLDWGLAKARNRADLHEAGFAEAMEALNTGNDADLSRTSYGQIVGTPAYMSPEQARGHLDRVDERSDVYSLGAVLYEILTGTTPHVGVSKLDILLHVLERAPRPVAELAPGAPPELIAICSRALDKDPAKRYPDARELAEEVIRFQSGAVVRAYDYSMTQLLRRFYQRNRAAVHTAAAAALLLLVGLVYFNVRLYQSREAERAQRVAAEEANERLAAEAYASTIVAAQKYVNERNVERSLEYLDRCPDQHRGWEWGHLMRACRPFLSEAPHDVLKVATANPLRSRFSADDRYVLSKWNSHGVITIFDRTENQYIYYSDLDQFLGFPRTTDFGPDPGHFTAGLDLDSVVYFDWRRGEIVRQFDVPAGWLTSFRVSPDGRIAAGMVHHESTGARELFVWDFQSGAQLRKVDLPSCTLPDFSWGQPQFKNYAVMAAHPLGVVGGFIQDSRELVFTDDDLCVLNLESGEIRRIAPCPAGVVDVDEKRGWAVYARPNTTAGQWDLINNVRLPRLAGATEVADVSYGGRERASVVVRESAQTWSLWDAESGTLFNRHHSDTLSLWGLDVADGEPIAVTLAANSHLRFWQVGPSRVSEVRDFIGSDGEPMPHRAYLPYAWPYRSFAVHPARTKVAILGDDGVVRIWRIPELTLEHAWTPPGDRLTEIGFSPDGALFTTTTWDGWARVWSVEDWTERRAFAPLHDEACFTAALSPDNRTIALGYGERGTTDRALSNTPFYNMETGELIHEADLAGHRVNKLAYSPDGGLLFVGVWGLNGSTDNSFVVYRAGDLTAPVAQVTGLGWGDQIAFDGDGSHALLHGGSLNPVYFNLRTLQAEYENSKSYAMTIAFHPDGSRFVAVAHLRHQAVVHRAIDGRILATLDDALGPAFFSADGRELYSLTGDGRFRIFYSEEWE